jgi:predicted Zn-dependent peptidase
MDTASVTVLILIAAGSRYETEKQAGISHFLEHMTFKGTKKRPTALQIAQEVDGMGGEWNAYTSKDYTGYYIKAEARHLPDLFDILSDMTLNSLLSQEEIDREKGVIIEEINMYEDTPIRKIGSLFEELMFGKTPLGRDIAGSKDTVSSFTRDDFVAYMRSLYKPNNAIVAVAGGVDGFSTEKTVMLTETLFTTWQKGHTISFKPQTISQNAPKIKVFSKKTEQVHVCVGVPALSRTDPKRYVLGVLTTILGGGMSSRLFHEVRERRGLAYYVKSGSEKYEETGAFVTQAGIDKKNLLETVKIILSETDEIGNNSKKHISKEELSRAKEYMKGHIVLGLEDSQAVAEYYGLKALLDNEFISIKQLLSQIDKVTVGQVTELAKELFLPSKTNIAVIGPFEDSILTEKQLRNLIY